MTVRFYLVPIVRLASGWRTPKYFQFTRGGLDGINCSYTVKDYGSIDMSVVCADILDPDHATLILNADVYSFPLALDVAYVVGERQAANAYFEAHGIPGDWLSSGDTGRSILCVVTSLFLYLQRVLGLLNYPVDPYAGLSLNTQYRNIPIPLHDAMQQGAISLGYTWAVNDNDQIRKIFKQMADQWGTTPILFGLATL